MFLKLGHEFVVKSVQDPKYLEEICGLTQLYASMSKEDPESFQEPEVIQFEDSEWTTI